LQIGNFKFYLLYLDLFKNKGKVTARELLHIINNGNNISEMEYQSLVQLHHEFPYFVLPVILAAKSNHKESTDTPNEFLHHAAIQSPNRKRLKFLIENPIPFLPFLPDQEVSSVETTEQLAGKPDENLAQVTGLPADESSLAEEKESEPIVLPPEKEEQKGESEATVPAIAPAKKRRGDVLKELEANLNRIKSTGQDNRPEPADHSLQEGQSKQDEPSDLNHELAPEALMASIKMREKKNVSDEKKQIQDELIEEFNKKAVKLNLSPITDQESESTDLSLESTRLKENLISESFAKILVRQKKINEAKEIYRKLQLKFPHKKAYFADCLNQLEDN